MLDTNKPVKTMNKKQAAQKQAVDTLKQWGLVDGTTVYAKVNNVSRSGMSRNISLYIIEGKTAKDDVYVNPRMIDISYHAAKALEWGYKEGYNGGIRVSGCGMDMLFHTVYSLSYVMGYGALDQSGSADKNINKEGYYGLRYRQL